MYVLVEYTDEQNVAVIPDNWLDGRSCALWPDDIKGPGKLMKAVVSKMTPRDSWRSFPIKELYRNGKDNRYFTYSSPWLVQAFFRIILMCESTFLH